MSEPATCQEMTGSGRGQTQFVCGRPIVEDGLCARHLAGRRRSEATQERWRNDRESASAKARKSMIVAKRLSELGFESHGFGDSVRMSRDVAERLIERLEK